MRIVNGYRIEPKADLHGVDLRGADLREADLRWSNLRGANLRGANLRGADLREADLREADLEQADLYWADITEADLRGSNLRKADFRKADLRLSDLRLSDLLEADLRWANLRGANLPECVPIVENIDQKMLEVSKTENFDMAKWHSACGTTHCRAGWAIEFAGEAGKDLEKRFGPSVAGALIYAASGSSPVPNWVAPQDEAIDDIKRRAHK